MRRANSCRVQTSAIIKKGRRNIRPYIGL
jgi:hypothetical protein